MKTMNKGGLYVLLVLLWAILFLIVLSGCGNTQVKPAVILDDGVYLGVTVK